MIKRRFLTGAARRRYKTYGILKRLNVSAGPPNFVAESRDRDCRAACLRVMRRSDIGSDKTSFTPATVAMAMLAALYAALLHELQAARLEIKHCDRILRLAIQPLFVRQAPNAGANHGSSFFCQHGCGQHGDHGSRDWPKSGHLRGRFSDPVPTGSAESKRGGRNSTQRFEGGGMAICIAPPKKKFATTPRGLCSIFRFPTLRAEVQSLRSRRFMGGIRNSPTWR